MQPRQAAAALYHNRSIIIESTLSPDGSVEFLEKRSIYFLRAATSLHFTIKMPRGATFSNLVVFEETAPDSADITEKNAEETAAADQAPKTSPPQAELGANIYYNPVEPGNIGNPGDFSVNLDAGKINIAIFLNAARGEERSIYIRYLLRDVITVHQDVAEFYHLFIDDTNRYGIDYMMGNLILPLGAPENSIFAWGRGPFFGGTNVLGTTQIVWETYRVPPRTPVVARAVFPPSLVPDMDFITERNALYDIIREEKQLRLVHRILGYIHRFRHIIILLIVMITALIFRSAYRQAILTPKVYHKPYHEDFPANYSPAEVSFLLGRGQETPAGIIATLVDLIRRNHIGIDLPSQPSNSAANETSKEDRGDKPRHSEILLDGNLVPFRIYPKEGDDNLRVHEAYLYSLIMDNARQDSLFTLFSLNDYVKKNPKVIRSFQVDWVNSLKRIAWENNFFGPAPFLNRFGLYTISVIFIALGITTLMLTYLISIGQVLIAGGIFLAAGRLFLPRSFSAHGSDQYHRWQAFRRYLQSISQACRKVPAMPDCIREWEAYLPYALALEVEKEMLWQIGLIYPNLQNLQKNGTVLPPVWELVYSITRGRLQKNLKRTADNLAGYDLFHRRATLFITDFIRKGLNFLMNRR